MAEGKMRFFIALEIPEENKDQFVSIQQELHQLIPQVRLTNRNKLHLTLAFVGDQPDKLQKDLTYIINNASHGVPSFEVTPAYIDGFPNIHQPQILWVGAKGDTDKILLIRERIKDSLQSLNLSIDERRFIPHITIAKISSTFNLNQDLEVKLEQLMAKPFSPIKITSIKLFESIPEGGFHQHNTLAEARFK